MSTWNEQEDQIKPDQEEEEEQIMQGEFALFFFPFALLRILTSRMSLS